MARRLRVVVAGSVAGIPGQGGWTWAVLQYVLGLRQLGHDVFWIDVMPHATADGGARQASDSTSARYFSGISRQFGLDASAALVGQGNGMASIVGPDVGAVTHRLACSDVLLNVSGVLQDPSLLGAARRRVYLDLDPGFTQLWQSVEGVDMHLDAHTDFVTIGPALNESGLPTLGRRWLTTLQPIVLAEWPAMDAMTPGLDAFTTVAHWRGYGSITFNGTFYGQKVHSFRKFLRLPELTGERFALALSIHADEQRDLTALRAAGWQLRDPADVAATPNDFRAFVQGSRAEIAVAKSGYAVTPTGWFSDRSICYLASGRPVAAQDTGFGAFVPTGWGLIPFTSLDEAAGAVAAIRADYRRHSRAARAIAVDSFDSGRVLTRLLSELGAG